MKKIALGVSIIILISILSFFTILFFTPKPLFAAIKAIPVEANLTKPSNYSEIEENISVRKNITYSNEYLESSLDIYSPKKLKESAPVILFIHGGGFFKGEKEMAKYFGPTLSNEEYIFVSINYNLAPNATVFDQIKQVNEAVKFIVENAEQFSINKNEINLAGSSAGGFLALQLLSAYHDDSYAKKIEIQPVKNTLYKSLLLYSAVFDLSEFQNFDGNILSNYVVSKMGWGLTGEKNWKQDKHLGQLLNLNNYISEKFPPIFITDGNTNTFTKQAKSYVARLEEFKVPTQTLFFDSKVEVGHGYQLNMASHASEKAVAQSLEFLKLDQ